MQASQKAAFFYWQLSSRAYWKLEECYGYPMCCWECATESHQKKVSEMFWRVAYKHATETIEKF